MVCVDLGIFVVVEILILSVMVRRVVVMIWNMCFILKKLFY